VSTSLPFPRTQTEAVDAATAAAAAQYTAIRARNASEFARLDAQRTADLAVRTGHARACLRRCCGPLRAACADVTACVCSQAMAQGFARVATAAGERAVTIWAPLAEGLTLRGVGAGPAPTEEEEAVDAEATAQGERATLSAAAGAADSD